MSKRFAVVQHNCAVIYYFDNRALALDKARTLADNAARSHKPHDSDTVVIYVCEIIDTITAYAEVKMVEELGVMK